MNFTGIKDVDMQIFNNLSDEDLNKLYLTSRYSMHIIDSDTFWMLRYKKEFGEVEYDIPVWVTVKITNWKLRYFSRKYGNIFRYQDKPNDNKLNSENPNYSPFKLLLFGLSVSILIYSFLN